MTTRSERRHENIVSRVSEMVGHTPLFHLGTTANRTRLLLKLEHRNPTGSTKVRMATQLVTWAERAGALLPGGRIVEPTSGNTGLGLALAAVEGGYRFTAIVDHHASMQKMRSLLALGAELVYVGEGRTEAPQTLARRAMAAELATEDNTWWPDQHNHPANPAGYRAIASELLADLSGDVDYLVAAVGTGGSLCGTARQLRQLGSRVRTIGVEPRGSIIFGGEPGQYWQTGSGSPDGFPVGDNVDRSLIDHGVTVGDTEAFATARVLARRTGLLIGGTGAGAVHVALDELDSLPDQSTVVVCIPDAGEKYLDTIFDDAWLREHDLLHLDEEHRIDTGLAELAWPVGLPTEGVA